MNKSYSELMSLKTFEERFDYLCDKHAVSDRTFGGYRWINQDFYSSYEWKKLIRPTIILRDNACDLAIPGRDIFGYIFVHHINPLTREDIVNHSDMLFNPENLICVSSQTHKAIHYGDKSSLILDPIERRPNDTTLWKD